MTEHSAENDAATVLGMVEQRIRHQMKSAQVGSMVWRAHMADLMHIEAVRLEVFPPAEGNPDSHEWLGTDR